MKLEPNTRDYQPKHSLNTPEAVTGLDIPVGGTRKYRDYTESYFVVGAIAVLLLIWFQWEVVVFITSFLLVLYYFFIFCIVLLMVIASVIQAVTRRKSVSKPRLFIPLAITATLILLIVNVPFTQLYLKADFAAKTAKREEVIQLIESGEITFGGKKDGVATLPKEYISLSKGWQVMIDLNDDNVNVLFFTFRGILDNFSGYAYLSGDPETAIKAFVSDGDLREFEKIKDHWYWVSSS